RELCGGGLRRGGGSGFGEHAVVNGEESELEAVRDSDLVVHVAQVILDDLFGGAQLRGDLFILIALHDQRDDLQLFWGQAVPHAGTHLVIYAIVGTGGDGCLILHPTLPLGDFADALHQRGSGHVAEDNPMHAAGDVARQVLSVLSYDLQLGVLLAGGGDDV